MGKGYRVLKPEEWLADEWEGTSEGSEQWLSARKFGLGEAYEKLKEQYSVRNMPLGLISLGWIKYGYEEDDADHDGEQLYWRRSAYVGGAYPIWYLDEGIIEKYGGVV